MPDPDLTREYLREHTPSWGRIILCFLILLSLMFYGLWLAANHQEQLRLEHQQVPKTSQIK